jgi:hypothetical protein
MSTHIICVTIWMTLYGLSIGWATPGPESTLLVINLNSAESVSIGEYYAERRHIAPSFRCEINVEPSELIAHDVFEQMITRPVLDCITQNVTRIEAIVLTRGVPLRVAIRRVDVPEGSPPLTVSSASLLSVAQSTQRGVSLAAPEQSEQLAELLTCENFGPCWSPTLENPWKSGHFSP